MKKSRPKATKPAKPKAKRNGDLTPSTRPKKPYTKERVAGLKPAWESGQSGNPGGRPVGARSKLNETFLEAVLATWQRHGDAALEWLAVNERARFVEMVAMLVPKQVKSEIEMTPKPRYWISDSPHTP